MLDITLGKWLGYLNLRDALSIRLKDELGEYEDYDIILSAPWFIKAIVDYFVPDFEGDQTKIIGLYSYLTEFENEIELKPIRLIDIEGEKYYCPEDFLDIPLGGSDFETSLQALQIEAIYNEMKEGYKDKDGVNKLMTELSKGYWDAIPLILATIYRKKGERLKEVNVTKRAELFKTIPAEQGIQALSFFLTTENKYIVSTLRESFKEEKESPQPN